MYFLNSILYSFLVVCSGLFIYQTLSNRKDMNVTKKSIMTIFLFFIEVFLLLLNHSNFLILVIDFSCLLAYLLKLKKEAILFSIFSILVLFSILNIPWYYHIIHILYFIVFQKVSDKKRLDTFIFIKAGFTSFVYFYYFDNSVTSILLLIATFIYFYLLLKWTYQQLRDYEKNKNEDTIIFQIAHEVKNPIAVCKGYLDMLDTNNIEKVNRYIPIIRSEMNRSLMIMDDFLNLKRLTIKKDIMDFNLLLEDVEQTMQTVLGNQDIHLEIISEKEEEEMFLEGDYDRLKQVLVNLIKNAKEANAKNIYLYVDNKNNDILLKIIDDGDGIAPKDLKKIGEAFYTTKKYGTGIGVSISKEIIKLHQGKIHYDSSMGKGTTVSLTLPGYIL